MKRVLIATIVCLSFPAAAEAPVIKDRYGFDWLRPKASKCVKVTGALLTKLTTSYVCTAPADPLASPSGKRLLATCKAKKGQSEYLLLATAADCNEEREVQLALGDG